jgi:hypothetical protein
MDVIELPTDTAMERAAFELRASLDTEQRERIPYEVGEAVVEEGDGPPCCPAPLPETH